MSRARALEAAAAAWDEGRVQAVLARRVAQRTESTVPGRQEALHDYLRDDIGAQLQHLGFAVRLLANPVEAGPPFLLAERREPDAAFTVLSYAHGDVVDGQEGRWSPGLDPWRLVQVGDRLHGRGTADNKGQHTINLAALAEVIALRGGRLGYDVKLLMEMGEEVGSPGLHRLCTEQRQALAADLFLASDGPRVAATRPTLFLGSRGGVNFDLRLALRAGGHHSGNWGGLLRNPGIRLAHAIASLVDARGRILVPALRPELPAPVRAALADITVGGGPRDPAIDTDWGEPGLTPAERVFGWNTLEVLAFKTGQPDAPVNAIPGVAHANCQLRFVVGTDSGGVVAHVREHLQAHGFGDVEVSPRGEVMEATRLDPEHPWVAWALASMGESAGQLPALLPNLGGTVPNDIFAQVLGLPTLWVPHSHPACAQHAPDEHLLASVAREALQVMAGLFWDLGEAPARSIAAARTSSGQRSSSAV